MAYPTGKTQLIAHRTSHIAHRTGLLLRPGLKRHPLIGTRGNGLPAQAGPEDAIAFPDSISRGLKISCQGWCSRAKKLTWAMFSVAAAGRRN
ncbi:hypothetical protein [Limnobacter litoralis]|uniref:hypothetical protein n=1 Tax=Limnobacter litoralis TaxID=481366 RepID=UPI0024E14891|nr:hypothetical protein [Limnobacter litoralis]